MLWYQNDHAASSAPPPEAHVEYTYPWNSDINIAHRFPVGENAQDNMELAKAPELPDEEAHDDNPYDVAFPDGTHAITDITISHIINSFKHGKFGLTDPRWTAEHKDTKNKFDIAQKTVRALLVSLSEQSRQILQVRLNKFGKIARPSTSTCST